VIRNVIRHARGMGLINRARHEDSTDDYIVGIEGVLSFLISQTKEETGLPYARWMSLVAGSEDMHV
jgi:hypothetical protein